MNAWKTKLAASNVKPRVQHKDGPFISVLCWASKHFFFETLGWQGWADGLTRTRISAVVPALRYPILSQKNVKISYWYNTFSISTILF